MKTKTIRIADLSIDPANARKHSQRNLEAITESLRRFGQQKPIVIDNANIVRAGNGTLEAARQLGWETIEAVQTDLTGSEASAYAIADNRTAELAEWDDDILKATLEALADEDAALLESCGYTEAELDALIGEVDDDDEPGEITEDEVPEPPADPITKPGDLWILGRHRVLCGDSTKAEDVARLMDGEAVKSVVCDPPYGIAFSHGGNDTSGIGKGKYKTKFAGEKIVGDDHPFDPLPLLSFPHVILWGGNHFASRLPDMPSWLIWDKRSASEHTNDFADCELAWTNLGTVARVFRHHWDGMINASERGVPRVHPTQKPIALMAWCIKKVDGVVYDPFLGSGTTLIAAEQLGRTCYGMEISPQYCDVIVKRWENLTGEKATLETRGT
jgi:hypothetical protein